MRFKIKVEKLYIIIWILNRKGILIFFFYNFKFISFLLCLNSMEEGFWRFFFVKIRKCTCVVWRKVKFVVLYFITLNEPNLMIFYHNLTYLIFQNIFQNLMLNSVYNTMWLFERFLVNLNRCYIFRCKRKKIFRLN